MSTHITKKHPKALAIMVLCVLIASLLSVKQVLAWLATKFVVLADFVIDGLAIAAAGYLGLLGAAAVVGVCWQFGRLALESKHRGENFDAFVVRALLVPQTDPFYRSMARARMMQAVERVAPALKLVAKRSEALRQVRLHRNALRDDKALASWATQVHDAYEQGQNEELINKINEAKEQESWRAFGLLELFARLSLWAISLRRFDWRPSFREARFPEEGLTQEQGWTRLLELRLMVGDSLLTKALGPAPEVLVLPAPDAEALLKRARQRIDNDSVVWDDPTSSFIEVENVAREHRREAPQTSRRLIQDVQHWRERLGRFPEEIYEQLAGGEVDHRQWPDWFQEGVGAMVLAAGLRDDEGLKRRYCVRAWVLGASQQSSLLPESSTQLEVGAEVVELAPEVMEIGPVSVVEELF